MIEYLLIVYPGRPQWPASNIFPLAQNGRDQYGVEGRKQSDLLPDAKNQEKSQIEGYYPPGFPDEIRRSFITMEYQYP